MIGQWLHQQILRRHLEHLGCRVEFGSTLQAIEQEGDSVVARVLKTKGGEELEETARFAYVVGADGAHSKFHSFIKSLVRSDHLPSGTVRKALDIDFVGESRDTRVYLIDARIDGMLPEGKASPNQSQVHILTVLADFRELGLL